MISFVTFLKVGYDFINLEYMILQTDFLLMQTSSWTLTFQKICFLTLVKAL